MFAIEDLFDLDNTNHAELFDEIEYPWDVLPLIKEYLEYQSGNFSVQADTKKASYIGKDIHIGKGTVIEPGVVIHGPAIIGENCRLRTGAYIRGNVIVGDYCMVGNSTEIKNSLLFNHAIVPHFNYIGDSILGYKVHLGSSVVLSNVKTPPSEIKVVTLEKTYHTGLKKFGAIIGDHCEIGANAVLNPGSIIGKNCIIYPLALIRGVVNSDSIVKVRQTQQIALRKEIDIDFSDEI